MATKRWWIAVALHLSFNKNFITARYSNFELFISHAKSKQLRHDDVITTNDAIIISVYITQWSSVFVQSTIKNINFLLKVSNCKTFLSPLVLDTLYGYNRFVLMPFIYVVRLQIIQLTQNVCAPIAPSSYICYVLVIECWSLSYSDIASLPQWSVKLVAS